MKIGGEYRLRDIGPRQWRKLATELRLDPERIVNRVAEIASHLPERVAFVRHQIAQQGVTHPIVDRLASAVTARAKQCLSLMRM
jgi:serine/threonine-protein kinase HipA